MNASVEGFYQADESQGQKQWTFLNNHAHVLLCLARDPDMVLREVALKVGITERATQKIIKDLAECQVLERYRVGRCNSYRINLDLPLRHPLEKRHTVGELLAMFLSEEEMARAESLGMPGPSDSSR